MKNFIYLFMASISFLLLCLITFVIFSFSSTIIYIYEDGGLSPLNYSYVLGHLLILIFGLGCFYFSIKTTIKMKNEK